jgi:anti-anti-sigma regulatory factor
VHSASISAPPPHTGMAGFTVRVDLVAGRMQVSGELDRRTAHCLLDAISTLQFAGPDDWIVDLTDLGSCDEDGVLALCAAFHRAAERRRPMTLVGASPVVTAGLAAWGVLCA